MSPLKVGVVAVVTVVIQLTVFVDVRLGGVAPELLALLAVLTGFLAGPERGPTIAFAIGVLWDIYLPTPLGLSAITFAIVAFAVGSPLEQFDQIVPTLGLRIEPLEVRRRFLVERRDHQDLLEVLDRLVELLEAHPGQHRQPAQDLDPGLLGGRVVELPQPLIDAAFSIFGQWQRDQHGSAGGVDGLLVGGAAAPAGTLELTL